MRFADAPDVLTVAEAAAHLRIGRNAAYQLVASGELWAVKVGKSIRIPKSALAAFLHLDTETGASVSYQPEAPTLRRVTANDRNAA